jgi:heptosyltransferase III
LSRIFLLRPGAIGDLFLTVPALRALCLAQPDACITLAGQPEAAALLQSAGIVDEALSQDDVRLLGLFQRHTIGDLEALGRFDAAVAWLNDSEGVVTRNLERWALGRVIVASPVPPPGPIRHVADHLRLTLAPLGVGAEPPERFYLRPAEPEIAWAEKAVKGLLEDQRPVITLHPGSGGRRKNWPAGKFALVAQWLIKRGVAVLLVCGPADEEAVAGVISAGPQNLPVVKDISLSRLAAVLAHSRAYLGNDSGVTHLAALVGTPTVALFGPSEARLWAPRGERVHVLSWLGDRPELTPEVVAETVAKAAGLA